MASRASAVTCATVASVGSAAADAVELFVYRVGRELGSLAAALGGLNALVFTGGMGGLRSAAPESVARGVARHRPR